MFLDKFLTNSYTFSFPGKPVMIVTEYMENGSLDTFLKVLLRSFFQEDLKTWLRFGFFVDG